MYSSAQANVQGGEDPNGGDDNNGQPECPPSHDEDIKRMDCEGLLAVSDHISDENINTYKGPIHSMSVCIHGKNLRDLCESNCNVTGTRLFQDALCVHRVPSVTSWTRTVCKSRKRSSHHPHGIYDPLYVQEHTWINSAHNRLMK